MSCVHRQSIGLVMGEGKPLTMVMATKYCIIVVMYIYILVHFFPK